MAVIRRGERPALLALADGSVFRGLNFGAVGEAAGEVVFNTAMTGYQEILTDPSYKGQLVAMTYPEIGNYGVNDEDVESSRPYAEGFIVKEYWSRPSNFRSKRSLGGYLRANGIIGIHGIDTRALVFRLREQGSVQGIISTRTLDPKRLVEKARGLPGMVGQDLVPKVTCRKPWEWSHSPRAPRHTPRLFHVVCFDFGIKWNILRMLTDAGCSVTVVPATTPAEEVLERNPDGIFLSNGPGDPAPVTYAIETVKRLIGKKPIFGICLGHQILGLAFGGRTFKLKFGHHGANHPVMDLETGKVEITSQNHGFAVDPGSVGSTAENPDAKGLKITHLNLNDRTVEGMRHKELPVFSVQYHPEASPGPHEAAYLFGRFRTMMQEGRPPHA